MAGDPESVGVLALQFDQANVDHLARHDVTPQQVQDVLLKAPRFFRNLPDRSGTHVIVGPNSEGTFFFIVLAPTGQRGNWRPVTGWRLGRRAQDLYERGVDK